MASKKGSAKSTTFAKGGGGHMFPRQSSGPQKPGQTASAGRSGAKFASGGKGKMFGFTPAGPAKPGVTK